MAKKRLEHLSRYRAECVLAGLLLLLGFLNIWNQGISNEYYAAGGQEHAGKLCRHPL